MYKAQYPDRINSYLSCDVDSIITRFIYKRTLSDIKYPFDYKTEISPILTTSAVASPLSSPRTLSGHFVPLPLFTNILLDENNLPYISV